MFRSKHHATDHRRRPDIEKRYGGSRTPPSQYSAYYTTYDADSGQVYTERFVHAPKKGKSDWINEYKTPSLVKRRRENREGAASLFDMAKAKVAREMRNLTASHFKGVSPFIGKQLWDEIEDRYEAYFISPSSKLMTY